MGRCLPRVGAPYAPRWPKRSIGSTESVQQPSSNDPPRPDRALAVATSSGSRFRTSDGHPRNGRGDIALSSLLNIAPGFAAVVEEAGSAPVAAFLLDPVLTTWPWFKAFERGFSARATAIISSDGPAAPCRHPPLHQ
jgi:hypothetical protein